MGLFDRFKKPKWEHNDPEVRKEAVKKLDDQKILVDIAKNDSVCSVRCEAVRKINDISVLVDIIKNSNGCVDEDIIEKIDDENILKNIFNYIDNELARQKAVRRIHDETFLADVALNDSNKYVRELAEKNIINKSILANKIDKNTPNYSIMKHISDPEQLILANQALNHPDFYERMAAVSKINDDKVLIYISKNDSHLEKIFNLEGYIYKYPVRDAAKSRLNKNKQSKKSKIQCPNCNQQIPANAIRCKYCKTILKTY